MKSNFVLTPDTYRTFINRFNKLLSITGAIESVGYYAGRNKRKSVLVQANIKSSIEGIIKTQKSYTTLDTVKYDSYPSCENIYTSEGIIIRYTSDCCHVYYWGTKFRFTSNRIYELSSINEQKIQKVRQSAKSVFSVCKDINLAKSKINFEEEMSKAYWNDADNFDF